MNYPQLCIRCLCILASLCCCSCEVRQPIVDKNHYAHGAIVRADTSQKQIVLVFTGASKADGVESVVSVLRRTRVRASFFLTGSFFNRFPHYVQLLKKENHYIGPHGYDHLLYCAWENRDSTLVTQQQFADDLLYNYAQLQEFGIKKSKALFFMPPYEYYNRQIADWSKIERVKLINFTPGTWSNADYTTPDMKNYRSSEAIYQRILKVESEEGLNGHILLFHVGTSDERTDKYYLHYLEQTIITLQNRGYRFVSLRKAVGI